MLNRTSVARTLFKQANTKAPRSAVALAPRASAAFSTSRAVARPEVKLMGVAMANKLAKDPNYKPERKIFSEFSLEGRVAAVTGGNSGIGLEGAMGLIEQGAKHVYVLDMADSPSTDFNDCAKLAEKFGGKLTYHQCNVTDPEAVDHIFVEIEKEHNRLDVLFAAAGILGLPEGHGCEDYPPEVFQKVLAVNTTGVFFTAQAAARVMKRTKTPGSIVMVASMSGSVTNRGERWTPYNVSKAGVIQMARSMACELGPDNIRVNSLSPGHIYTKLTAALLDNHPEYDDKWSALNPMGRIGAVHELRGALAWLSSDASSYATGTDVLVCGGHTSW